MNRIQVNAVEGDGISIHAPSRIIDQFAAAFSSMPEPVGYSVARSEDGADLLTTRAALDAVLAKNPVLKAQFDRDTAEDVRPDHVRDAARR